MNEKRIEEVIAIEKQASEVYNKAVKDADRIPVQAEKEAKGIIDKARAEAETEAQEILANSQPRAECDKILTDAANQIEHNEAAAKRHFDRAVTYVISRVLGRE